MKLGRSYQLAFYAGQDIAEFVKGLLDAERVQEMKAPAGPKFILAFREEELLGVGLAEEEEGKVWKVRILRHTGDVESYAVYTGERVIVPRKVIKAES